MKVLLDENLSHKLRKQLPGHDVFTVKFMGWDGQRNGELLALAAAEGFDVLVTMDASLPSQQNLGSLPFAVLILSARSNRYKDVMPLMPRVLHALTTLKAGTVTHVS